MELLEPVVNVFVQKFLLLIWKNGKLFYKSIDHPQNFDLQILCIHSGSSNQHKIIYMFSTCHYDWENKEWQDWELHSKIYNGDIM